VVPGITAVPATAMIDALAGGERRGAVLADLARGRMRTAGKPAGLPMALAGRLTGHHALPCRLHQDRTAAFGVAVADLDERIAGKAARWHREAGLLTSVPGFGDVAARAWPAGTGPAPHPWLASHEKPAHVPHSLRRASSGAFSCTTITRPAYLRRGRELPGISYDTGPGTVRRHVPGVRLAAIAQIAARLISTR
jgi:hypothetical protein